MAYISIYDATPTDQQQLGDILSKTDHYPVYSNEPINENNLHPETEVLSVFVTSKVSRSIIDKLPKLQLIACRSTGFNNIDTTAAAERGITVVNVPTYGERTVAEYTFTLILALMRQLKPAIDSLSALEFDQKSLMGADINGKTIGIIGMGRIGQQVARLAVAFGMKVIAYDPHQQAAKASEIGFSYVELEELAKISDIISLHSPYTRDNHHLINADFLTKVKPTALLINTARGELVDTQSLVKALREKKLAGAGIDVLEGEELLKVDEEMMILRQDSTAADLYSQSIQIDVLKRLPNVIVTPHNAFNTVEALARINQISADNMIQFWYGNTPNKIELEPNKPGKLIIVRHGESEWNALGKWTGSRDVHLSEKGFREAAMLGLTIKDIHLDYAFASQQLRSFETLSGIVDAAQQFTVPYERSAALNERDYGEYTGFNKWEIKEELGEEVFQRLRRDWNYPVPGGETLKMVYERVVPFYQQTIMPKLMAGQNVLVVSHGNAIRTLVKYIEGISDQEISNVEMLFGTILIYDVDKNGRKVNRQDRAIASIPPPA